MVWNRFCMANKFGRNIRDSYFKFVYSQYIFCHNLENYTKNKTMYECIFFQSLDKHGLFSHTSNGVQFFCDGSLCHGLKGRP